MPVHVSLTEDGADLCGSERRGAAANRLLTIGVGRDSDRGVALGDVCGRREGVLCASWSCRAEGAG